MAANLPQLTRNTGTMPGRMAHLGRDVSSMAGPTNLIRSFTPR
jgi:hypothetical protein